MKRHFGVIGWALAAAAVLALPVVTQAQSRVVWIYPLPGSLIRDSPIPVRGYVEGPLRFPLEAVVEGPVLDAAPRRVPLEILQDRVFSGFVELTPGRNRVLVGTGSLEILYRPGFDGDREGAFRKLRVHPAALEACAHCHESVAGQLTVRDPVPELCRSCHAVGTESVPGSVAFNEHARSVTPDCARCHSPHASFQPALLRSEENLCLPCHEDYGRPSGHDGAGTRPCTVCHDPHASAYPKLVRRPGTRLCSTCHESVADPYPYPRSYHEPAENERCFDCHIPHGNGPRALLRTPVPHLCRTCHDRAYEQNHEGELEECRSCHRAHLSERPGLMTGDVSEACVACHGELPEAASRHPALEEGCVSCHSDPHKPRALGDSWEVCGRCHHPRDEAFRWTHGRLPMPDVRQCTFCHEPHASKYAYLLRGWAHAPLRTGRCTVCHEARLGRVELRYEGYDACLRCHGGVTGTSLLEDPDKVHKSVYERHCTACHDPHLGVRPNRLLADPVELCLLCHGTLFRELQVEHGVFEGGGTCYACHEAHSSDFKPLLKTEETKLCTGCHLHVAPAGPGEESSFHGAFLRGRCSGCHNPHGGDAPPLLKLPANELCADCHPEVAQSPAGVPWRYPHSPVAAGRCDACHRLGHRREARQDAFLIDVGGRVCTPCHAIRPGHVPRDTMAQVEDGRDDCPQCHRPHGSDERALLRPTLR